MKKGYQILLVAILVLLPGACSTDNDGSAKPDGSFDLIGSTGADPEFGECIASLAPVCEVQELDTLEEMELETPCANIKFISIPLTNGGTYGPMTIPGGPYGAVVEWNEGGGTEFVNNVSPLEPFCLPFGVELFSEPDSVNAEILNTRGLDYSRYTIFRPACMKKDEKYPVITWANGTCGLTHGYVGLLSGLASYGFVIIASNSTWTAFTTSPDGTAVQLRALDYAVALNEDPDSIFYQKLDLDKTGAMGHSQGSTATSMSSSDPRIKALILWNGGTSDNKPFLYVSGERDIGGSFINPTSMASNTNNAAQPGAWIYYKQVLHTGGAVTGHLVLMEQPERVIDMTVAWWQWQLNGDQEAKMMFVGDNCGLCNSFDEYEYGHNNLLN